MNSKVILAIIATVIISTIFGIPYLYRILDEAYQKAQDPVRISDIETIKNIAYKYSQKVGHPPLADLVEKQKKPFMVLIGRSSEQEDTFSNIEALKKGALYINSKEFENILSKGLNKKITLPRDPQKVTTFAPNVYVYYINENQMCVAAHLYFPSDISQPYSWKGGKFHSHAQCFLYRE